MKARFYSHYGADPFFNMAVDDWMLGRALAETPTAMLRLYTWSPSAITFGHNQNSETAVDQLKLGETPLVRRITGGRALLHDASELTYSIAFSPVGGRAAPSPSSVYDLLASAFVDFLRAIGLPAEYCRISGAHNSRPGFFHKAPCFASHARYEVVSRGRKVVASAARRHGNALLQHGAIKIAGLAAHPALEFGLSVGETTPERPAPLSRDRFAELAPLLRQAVGRRLGVDFAPVMLVEEDEKIIRARADFIQKNPQMRRNFTKH